MFIDDLIEQLKDKTKTSIVMYADDLAMMALCKEDLQDAFEVLHDWCIHNGMKVNVRKTVVMKFAAGGGPSAKDESFFSYDEKPICLVKQFDYLGITLQPALCFSKHVKKLSDTCKSKIQLKARNASSWSINMAIKLFDILFKSKIRYGLDAMASLDS